MRQEGQSHEGQLYEGAYGGCNTNGFGNSDYFAYEPHAWWLRLSKDTIISVALLAPAGLLASFGVVSVSGVRARATFALAWAGLYQRRPPPILVVISTLAPSFVGLYPRPQNGPRLERLGAPP